MRNEFRGYRLKGRVAGRMDGTASCIITVGRASKSCNKDSLLRLFASSLEIDVPVHAGAQRLYNAGHDPSPVLVDASDPQTPV